MEEDIGKNGRIKYIKEWKNKIPNGKDEKYKSLQIPKQIKLFAKVRAASENC